MYVPEHFRERDPAAIEALITAHPLATLVTRDGDGDVAANHVPMLLDRSRGVHGTLVGHVARANPAWQAEGAVLAVFTGPDAYISPSWYPSKAEHGKVVPTWNYTAVHAYGTLRATTDPGILLGIVGALTRRHEADRTDPWAVEDAPHDYIESMLRAIVGIEIEIERVEAKCKLSQNRPEPDRRGVWSGLSAEGSPAAGLHTVR